MPALPLTWRERLAIARADPTVRKAFFRVGVVGVGSVVAWAIGRLCIHLPEAFEPACHAAAKLARVVGFALGGG